MLHLIMTALKASVAMLRKELKKIAVIFLFLLFTIKLWAIEPDSIVYRDNISIAPLTLYGKIHITYEHLISEHFSAGIGLHYYYPQFILDALFFETFKADLYCRFYTGKDKVGYGFYLQPQASGGVEYDNPDDLYNRSAGTFKLYNYTGGVGFCVGYKFFVFKKLAQTHIPVDFSLGMQYYRFPVITNDIIILPWYFFGPGSLVLCRLSVGYAF
jgi:hypothetical protein